MIVNILKYAITLTIGIIIGFFLLDSEKTAEKSTTETTEIDSAVHIDTPGIPAETETIQLTTPPITDNSDELKTIINQQQRRIKQLEQALSQRKTQTRQSTTTATSPAPSENLETITMRDFESKIQDQFVDRFKGYAIEIEENQLAEFQKGFESNSNKDQWSAEYENSINDFLADADPNNLHFIEEVSCNTSMCRLRVQSSESNHWQQIYSQMTRQQWFNSITLKEPATDPNYFTYYIPKPQKTNR